MAAPNKQHTVVLVKVAGVWTDVTEAGRVRAEETLTVHRGLQDEGSAAKPGTLNLTFDNRDGWALPTSPISPFYADAGLYVPITAAVRPGLTSGPGADVVDTFTRTSAGSWGTADSGQVYSGLTLGSGGSSAVGSGVGTHSIAGAVSAKGELLLGVSMLDGDYLVEGIAAPLATGGDLEVAGVMHRGQSASVYGLIRMHITTGAAVQVRAYRAANQAQIGSTYVTGITHTGTGQPLSMRVLVIGRTILVKVWITAAAQPAAWQVEFTDTSPIRAGWVGIRTGRGSGNSNAGVTASYAAWSMTQWDVLAAMEIHTWVPTATGNFDVANWRAGTIGTQGDASTRITASGLLHRLNAGRDPLRTAAYRRLSQKQLRGYWPMEDRGQSAAVASAVASGTAMQVVTGRVDFAGAELAPQIGNTLAGAGVTFQLDGYMEYPTSTSLGNWNAGWLFSGLTTASQVGVQFVGNNWVGSATNRTDFTLQLNGAAGSGGRIQLYRITYTGTTTTSSTLVDTDAAYLFDESFHLIELLVSDSGANVDWFVFVDSVLFTSGTLVTVEYATLKRVFVAGSGPVTMGHLFVDDTTGWDANLWRALSGYPGETPPDRVSRLCSEEGIGVDIIGDYADTMGPQYPDTLVALLTECAATNDAMLFEAPSWLGLVMWTRNGIYGQSPAATVDYTGGMRRVLPVIDTRGAGNDVTISNRDGRTWASEDSTRVAAVGRIKAAGVDTNYNMVSTGAAQLPRRAEWELAKGSIPGARYPALEFDLGAVPALQPTVGRVDVGLQVAVTGLEADTVYQLVRAITHQVGTHTRTLRIQGVDATLWRPGLWDSAAARWDSGTSTLTSSPAAGATSFFVTTTAAGDVWTTDPAHFPLSIIVGGEVITVAGITGATSPQQFTGLTRSVNGISKVHAAGAAVHIFRIPRYAL